MVKGLSTELAAEGIYVNCRPGLVDTDMARPRSQTRRRASVLKIPLGRGNAREIAAPILFFARRTPLITGEVFNVNGGAVLVG
jgi:NAD(P)-dependent dehydrogenase (short-subunit alcohol dehydrogenase family)